MGAGPAGGGQRGLAGLSRHSLPVVQLAPGGYAGAACPGHGWDRNLVPGATVPVSMLAFGMAGFALWLYLAGAGHLRQVAAMYPKDGFTPAYTADVTITEFSSRTGKPGARPGPAALPGYCGGPEVEWVSASGSVLIVDYQVQPPGMAASNSAWCWVCRPATPSPRYPAPCGNSSLKRSPGSDGNIRGAALSLRARCPMLGGLRTLPLLGSAAPPAPCARSA